MAQWEKRLTSRNPDKEPDMAMVYISSTRGKRGKFLGIHWLITLGKTVSSRLLTEPVSKNKVETVKPGLMLLFLDS